VPPFLVSLIKWKMKYSYITLLKNEDDNGFLLYIGSTFGNLNAI
jgi:hypothetical protein